MKLNVNGTVLEADVPGDMPLLWVLRDRLGITGPKFGCGAGLCGACTVLVDGKPERSCLLSASAVGTSRIVTIEGLSPDASHPVQRAWRELDVVQCGYCQSGQILAAAALLAEHPRPSDAQIEEAMAGNLCRCATYVRVREAIHAASRMKPGRTP